MQVRQALARTRSKCLVDPGLNDRRLLGRLCDHRIEALADFADQDPRGVPRLPEGSREAVGYRCGLFADCRRHLVEVGPDLACALGEALRDARRRLDTGIGQSRELLATVDS